MALSDDDFIHTNKGIAPGANAVVALAGADTTTAGNSVVIFIGLGSTSISAAPSGFVAMGTTGTTTPGCWIKSNVSAGETSWTFTGGSAGDAWIVLEVSNLETVEPMDTNTMSGQTSLSNGGTLATPAAQSVSLSTVQFAVFCAEVLSGTATKSWGSFTNGFTQVDQIESTTGSPRPTLAVTRTFSDSGAPASFTSTGTLTISTGSAIACRARMYIFRENDSPMAATASWLMGFGQATHGGLGGLGPDAGGNYSLLRSSTDTPVGTWGTHFSVDATAGRDGDPALRVNTSAATCNLPVVGKLIPVATYGLGFKVASGSGTPTLFTWDSTATDLLLVYDVATEKLGLQWAGGSVSWQTGTTPVDTWTWVEVRYKINATTHHADWWCETGDGLQTAPADLTGQVSSNLNKATFSGLTSQTVDFYVDDYVYSQYYAAFPMGPHRVRLLTVDPAGTPTVSGTSSNFSTFTANGTLAAWNATTARDALDEVPPTVSASADGVCQTATAASDYMEFPMQNLTLASDEVIAGVRVVCALWGGTGTATGTLGIYGWDGTTETTMLPTSVIYDAASPTAMSATEPMWMAAAWPGPWTKARLDAACIRVGKSTDATPDMGVSAVYLEVAVRKTAAAVVVHRLTDDEDPEAVAATVTELLHPFTSGVRTYTVSNNDATRTAVFNYSIVGTPQTAITVAPLDPPEDVTVNAEAFGEVDSTSFGWQ